MPMRAFLVLQDDPEDPHEEPQVGRSATVYEVDLASEPGQPVRQALRQYVRLVSGGTESFADDEETSATVRSWARVRGIPVSDRGRIPQRVWEQFYQDQLMKRAGSGQDKGSKAGDGEADDQGGADDEGPPGDNVVWLRPRQAGA